MDIVKRRWLYFALSALAIVPGAVSMLVPPAFRLGIEFTGGSAFTVEFQQPVSEADLRAALAPLGHGGAVIQRAGADTVFIRTAHLAEAETTFTVAFEQPVTATQVQSALRAVGQGGATVEPQGDTTVVVRTGALEEGFTALAVEFEEPVTEEQVREALAPLGHGDAEVLALNERSVLVRTRYLPEAEGGDGQGEASGPRQQLLEALEAIAPVASSQFDARRPQQDEVLEALSGVAPIASSSVEVVPGESRAILEALEGVAPIAGSQFDSVSPTIAAETVRNAAIAVVAATLVILLYITWAFRRVPNPFRYGVGAIVALVHDLLFVLGLTSILGKLFAFEVDAMFITAVLTVLGYSVHDTIVVYDRIRENVLKYPGEPLDRVANVSVLETMGRSINTSLTTVVVLAALLLLGGATIRNFLVVLLAGFVVGTYSSVFIAAQALVVWEKGELRRVFQFLRLAPRQARA